MIELIAALFAAAFVTAVMLALLTSSSRGMVERRLDALAAPSSSDTAIEGLLIRPSGRFPLVTMFLDAMGWSENAARDLIRAGLTIRVSEYFLIRVFSAGILGVLAMFLISGSAAVFVAIAAGAVGFLVPAIVLRYLVRRRQSALDGQLVETLQLVSNALRSGFAFTQAVEMASGQVRAPMHDELAHFMRDNSLGSPTDEALQAMVDRTGSLDLEMAVVSILIQRTTGGNLSEILDNVAETIRERERLKGEMRALTASQRFTGMILSIYPILLGGLFTIIAPSLMSQLWTEEVGRILLAVAIVLQGIGIFTISQILKLDV